MTGQMVSITVYTSPSFRVYCPFLSFLLRDPYVIALRSVSLPTHPPTEEYNRGEVLCAGFTILETKNNMSLVRLTTI